MVLSVAPSVAQFLAQPLALPGLRAPAYCAGLISRSTWKGISTPIAGAAKLTP